MTLTGTSTTATLPHWEETPDDLGAAIREIKAALRARIEASGRTVDEVFAVIEERIRVKVTEINDAKERGETVWPVIEYADIENGTVSPEEPGETAQPRVPGGPRTLPPRAGPGLGPGHRRLRGEQPVLRELPRPRRRLLRQRRLQTRDLPHLLVTGADAGPAERPDGPRPVLPQRAVDQRVRRGAVVRPRTGTRSTRTGSAAAPRAPTPQAWARIWIPARSTCG